MKAKFIKCTIAGEGRQILIKIDEIAAVMQNLFYENIRSNTKLYWSAKIIMASGKEISLEEPYESLAKELECLD